MSHSTVSAHWLLSFRFLSIIIFIAQNLLGDDVHETSRLCTVFMGTGTGAQGTFHPHPRGDFSLVYSCSCLVTRSCLTLFYPMDWTDCSVHGILQAKILHWVAISSSRGSFLTQGLNPCLLHWWAGSLPLSHLGSPIIPKQLFRVVFHSRLKPLNFETRHLRVWPLFSVSTASLVGSPCSLT